MDDISREYLSGVTKVDAEDQTSPLFHILLLFARNRSVSGWITGIFLGLGLLIAIFSPPVYIAQAKVIRESTEETGGSISGLAALRGLGISIGESGAGLTADTYPDIVRSREVRLAVAESKFYFPDIDSTMTLIEYNDRKAGGLRSVLGFVKKVTIQLPGTIMSLFSEERQIGLATNDLEITALSEVEYETIESLLKKLSINISRTNGIMTVAVSTYDRVLSVQITNAFIKHLRSRVREIYSEKASENVAFIRARFAETNDSLQEAEETLAKFLDTNKNPSTAQLQAEVESLKRQVTFKSQLYGDLQTQLMQAEISLQRSQPVITILERAMPPEFRSTPKRKFIVIMSILLGIFFSGVVASVRQYWRSLLQDTSNKEQYLEIRDALNFKKKAKGV